MHEFRPTIQNLSFAIIEPDPAMRSVRVRHDVVGKAHRRGSWHPTKQRPDQNIDATVALMMAIGRIEEEAAKGLEGLFNNPSFG
jgi:hypothetical protein